MADISKLLMAAALSGGVAHPEGHIQKAEEYGVPGRVDYSSLSEQFNQGQWKKMLNKKREGDVQSAGFEAQKRLAKSLEGTELQDEVNLFNALYKALYAVGVKPSKIEGDVKLIADSTHNKKEFVASLLALSALADFDKYKRPDRKWDLSPEMLGSGYGLKFSTKF